MAAKTGTYTLIASNTLGSSAASVTFSSIPATYTDLFIVCSDIISNRTSSQDIPVIVLNGDTATNYSSTNVDGGSVASSSRWTGTNNALMGFVSDNNSTANPSSYLSNFIINFQDYANTTTNKTFISRYNALMSNTSYSRTGSNVGLWRSTAAINSINIGLYYSTYAAGCTFKLYGIEAAK
jgi:hypothetical protein